MSDSESSHNIPKPAETYNQAKLRLEKELKALIKTSKGKAGKELVKQKEADIETELTTLREQWELYRKAEAGEVVSSPTSDDLAQDIGQISLYDARPVVLSKQQRKLKTRQEREDAEQKAAQDAVADLPDLRKIENQQFTTKLQKFTFKYGPLKNVRGAAVADIRGDGHCLFRAVLNQLTTVSRMLALAGNSNPTLALSQLPSWHAFWLPKVSSDVKEVMKDKYNVDIDTILASKSIPSVDDDIILLRRLSASHTAFHQDDYIPYLLDDIAFELGGIDAYCSAVTDMKNPIWGGEVELSALSQLFQVGICVLSVDQELVIGESFAKESVGALYLSYHKYYSSAGEHYNVVEPISDS